MMREAILGAVMAVLVTLLVFKKYSFYHYCGYFDSVIDSCVTITVMNMLGYTLNIMTLAGIAVAVGRVVDDSIVVIENVFRRVRATKDRDEEIGRASNKRSSFMRLLLLRLQLLLFSCQWPLFLEL